MKQSTLYNIIEDAYVAEWKEKFKTGNGGNLYKAIKQNEQELGEGLSELKKENIKRLSRSWENFYEAMIYELAIEMVHFGIKIGIEIENSNYID